MIRILDVGELYGYPVRRIFRPWIDEGRAEVSTDTKDIAEMDLVCFGGGADVAPEFYGHRNIAAWCDKQSKLRDSHELSLFRLAVMKGIPILGICRGSQMACVASGGALIQHVDNHGRSHNMEVMDGRSFEVTSTHHQMQYPNDVPHKLIGWSKIRSARYEHDIRNFQRPEKEPEIVYYTDTKALAVQGHPEYVPSSTPFPTFVRELIEDLLLPHKA